MPNPILWGINCKGKINNRQIEVPIWKLRHQFHVVLQAQVEELRFHGSIRFSHSKAMMGGGWMNE